MPLTDYSMESQVRANDLKFERLGEMYICIYIIVLPLTSTLWIFGFLTQVR